ncbi:MAG: KEOPS complex subunit Pcc1 [Candidatus Verstraetearchaeota archaeon]|nr:KEOPS complex subunit Pcc1 [Candidatus Verstraetearchaeota archaeon]
MEREYDSHVTAETVMQAVLPDNKGTPADTEIEISASGGKLIIRIASSGDLQSFLRTVDDLLFCIQTAERAIASLGKKSAPNP